MAFHVAPDPGDKGEPDVKIGRTGGSAVGEDRRLVTNGVEILASGSLACPACALPISPAPRVRPRHPLTCGWCEHTGPAVEFLRRDVVDAPANAVALVARIR